MERTPGMSVVGTRFAKEAAVETKSRRLNLVLAESVYGDLVELAQMRRSTMTEVIRLALGLVKVVLQEAQQGNRIVVVKPDGTVPKELVLPL